MTPIDQATRDQAQEALDQTLVLSAGAGSGKTSVLVRRVLNVLLAGVPARRIAVVTFTEKAAGELQERVRDGLDEAMPEALASLPELTLTTLHGFCLELLSSEALESGWAPDTEVIPAGLRAPSAAAEIARWREGFAERHPGPALLLRGELPGPKQLVDGINRLLETRDATPVTTAQPLEMCAERAEVRKLLDTLDALFATCLDPDDGGVVKNRGLRDSLARALAHDDDALTVAAALSSSKKGYLNAGKAGNWPDNGKAKLKAAINAFRAWRQVLRTLLHGLVVRDLREHLLPAIDDALRRSGQASYADLLFRAAELLRDNDTVRQRLADRYQAILVDEVQDTDPIQAEVAALLARSPTAEGHWEGHPPRPGHLFAVGDAKQSIYRFRRADVTIWGRLRGLAPEEGRLELQQNFRSVPGLVAWANHTFAELPDYTPQVAWRGPAALEPVVQVLAGEPGDALVKVLHRLEGAEVVDRDTGELRPFEYADAMVLLPSWGKSELLAQALAQVGIPAVVEGGRQFFDRAEVRLGLDVLRCIDEPGDTQACANVLRGVFGLSFEDLARHASEGGSLRYTIPEAPTGPVAEALEVLRGLHMLRGRRSLVRLFDELLEQTRADACWSLLPDGPARLANLDKLRVLIRQVEELGATPVQVIAELERLKREAQDEDLSRLDSDLDAVRITSVFKAKGREAPVVILACSKRTLSAEQHAVAGGEAWVKLSKLTPPDWDAVSSADKAAFGEERARWMYVAATRARDQLVVLHDEGSNLLVHLARGLPVGGHGETVEVGGAEVMVLDAEHLERPAPSRAPFPGLDVRALLDHPPKPPKAPKDDSLAASIEACRRWTSVGQVARQGKTIYGVPGGVGALGGTVVHEVLERLDLHASREEQKAAIGPLLEAHAEHNGLDEALVEPCREILLRILDREELDLARSAPFHWKEAPFTTPTEEHGYLAGVIDLAFPVDDSLAEWVVFDWKSTIPPEEHSARAVYERQLALYAEALIATVAPCAKVRTFLVGPHPELGVEGVPDMDLLFEELVPVVEALMDAGVPAPTIGHEVEGVPLELAWPEARVGVVVDVDDSFEGWAIVNADSSTPGWELVLLARLQAALASTIS